MSYFVLKIGNNYDQYLLSDFLSSFYLSKDKIKYLLNNNCCYVNGLNVLNVTLKINDEVSIDTSFYDINDVIPTNKNLDILYEDDYLLIVNKPANCIIYSDDMNCVETMANYVSHYYLSNNLDYKVRHAHRLDYDTTGALVYAKDIITHASISKMIVDGTFVRKYLAITEGVFSKKTSQVKAPIGKHRHKNGTMIVSKSGKMAITNYKVLDANNNKSLVLLKLETGRTHQIRVHMSYIGHPLLGDEKYGSKIKETRVFLHSHIVDFIHPITNKKVHIECKVPEDFRKYFDK